MTSDLLYSDTEEDLRGAVRAVLADRCPPESLIALYDTPLDNSGVSSAWKAIAVDLGLAGLLVPESLGGAGASTREAGVVMEELGRGVAPVPFLPSAVLATIALLEAGERDLLPVLASGATTATLAVPLSTPPGPFASPVRRDSGGLTGRVTSIAGTELADVLVVPVTGPSGLELHTVDRRAEGVTVAPVLTLDMTRPLADVEFSQARSTRVDEGSAVAAMHAALSTGAALLASEQFGVATWCFETTLAYVKERRQFGRAIGSFQALKHRIADLWLEVGQMNAAARHAADTCTRTDERETAIAVAVAQAYCGDAAVHVAEECVQLHGGIGMTWEYPAHLYLKRAKSDQIALGAPHLHRARLGELVDLPTGQEETR